MTPHPTAAAVSVLLTFLLSCPSPLPAAAEASASRAAAPAGVDVEFQEAPGRLTITLGGEPFAAYVYQDQSIPRPYFAHVFAPGGVRVTRNHPPVEGKDPTDHPSFHPGLWLAFADLNGADPWRNRDPVIHEKFLDPPQGGPGRGSFAVANRYASGGKTVCREICRYTLLARPAGWLLLWDSVFRSDDADFTFGDQEEMGLGVRVATPLAAKSGGRMLDSAGRTNEGQIWGKPADWCDYGGAADGKIVGITLMPDPNNFRRSTFHARDYGLLVANPFGRKVFNQGEQSRVLVKRGEDFRVRFGVFVHASNPEEPTDLKASYADYLKASAEESVPSEKHETRGR